jgi:hypothetical protein
MKEINDFGYGEGFNVEIFEYEGKSYLLLSKVSEARSIGSNVESKIYDPNASEIKHIKPTIIGSSAFRVLDRTITNHLKIAKSRMGRHLN